MYKIGYAEDYRQNIYHVIEKLDDITEDDFIKKAKEIEKEYHPTRFIYLENDKEILAIFRNNRLTLNKIWKNISKDN